MRYDVFMEKHKAMSLPCNSSAQQLDKIKACFSHSGMWFEFAYNYWWQTYYNKGGAMLLFFGMEKYVTVSNPKWFCPWLIIHNSETHAVANLYEENEIVFILLTRFNRNLANSWKYSETFRTDLIQNKQMCLFKDHSSVLQSLGSPKSNKTSGLGYGIK